MNKYFKLVVYVVVTSVIVPAMAGAYEDFFRAIRNDDAAAARALLQRGFDPNSVDETGQPALTLAARDGSPNVAEALLTHPAIRPDAANQAGETPLMLAALKGRTALAARLLERGAAVERTGWSPLHYAATGPAVDIVRMLLERGASVDSRSPNGTTPLMMAAQYGPEDAVTLLLLRRADARLRNEHGLNAADFARLGAREKLAERLDALLR
mgnify:CR=1 FL=1